VVDLEVIANSCRDAVHILVRAPVTAWQRQNKDINK
jgi:hypothetical protein